MSGRLARAALVLSLAANAAFVAHFALRAAPVAAPPRAGASAVSRATSGAATTPAPAARPASAQVDLWRALDAEHLPTFIARLRAAGFSASTIRAMVSAKVNERYQPRLLALRQQAVDVPYWRPAPNGPSRSAEYYEQRGQVFREQSQTMRDILAAENLAPSEGSSAYQRRRFGDLPRATIDVLERIEKDYADLTGEVRATARGIFLPEDRDTLDLLESEKRRDLERVLTPEQLADYELRTSPLTSRLSRALTLMDATSDEFQAIHEAYLPRRETLFPGIDGMGYTWPSTAEGRQARIETLQELLPELGEKRTMELLRATDSEFQQLAFAADRSGFPLSAAEQAYDVRTATCQESIRIGNDTSRSLEERKTALRVLADTTRQQLAGLLGPQGERYAKSAYWLERIAAGGVVAFDGVTTTMHSLPAAKPPKK